MQINDINRLVTGTAVAMSKSVKELQSKGYKENFSIIFDHIGCQSGQFVFYPDDIFFDDMQRFDNSSDPDDQAILYAISILGTNMKGLCAESYGLYHEDWSQSMIERMQSCRSLRQIK